MIYAFDINKLDVVCKNAKIIILTDSVKYHTAKFKFSEDWEHFSKTAYFINKSNDKDEKDKLPTRKNSVQKSERWRGKE